MKIAVTTTDGINVNQHFGKAEDFYIYDLVGGTATFLNKRNVQSYCETDEKGDAVDPDHDFSLDRFSLVYEVIKDCEKLYTQQIGDKPLEKLIDKGIKVQKCMCGIDSLPTCSGNCKN